jgi:hypothetical protein
VPIEEEKEEEEIVIITCAVNLLGPENEFT